MTRAERRRAEKAAEKNKVMYHLTKEQLHDAIYDVIGDELAKVREEAKDEAITTAMSLLLTLPLKVLMDHYWKKTYAKKLPEFTNYLIEYYEKWQNGELNYEDLKNDLWEYGGVRLEVKE